MDIKEIISISGRPGLYKVIATGKNSVIVESLIDKKRFPAYSSEKISSMEDISIFTTDEDLKLTVVFTAFLDAFKGGPAMDHKTEEKELRNEFKKFVPNYDEERVYFSDIRKVFQWYNLLIAQGILVQEKAEQAQEGSIEKEPKTKASKATASKSTAKAMKTPSAKAAKPAQSRKPIPVKTGSSRGK